MLCKAFVNGEDTVKQNYLLYIIVKKTLLNHRTDSIGTLGIRLSIYRNGA